MKNFIGARRSSRFISNAPERNGFSSALQNSTMKRRERRAPITTASRFALLLACCFGFVTNVFSAELTPKPAAQEDRFLFIVETSSAMSRSAKAAQQTIRELIESGAQGEMQSGDTFGLWTFGEKLDVTFPMQSWSPGESKKLAESAVDFLKKQRYENEAKVSVVFPPLYSVIKSSQSITVFLVTTGSEPIRGTPFDNQINAIYRQYSRELHEAKIPFVTVLIGHKGKPVAYSVNSSVGPIRIPQPPIEKEKPTTEKKTNTVAAVTNSVPVPAVKTEAKPKAPEVVVPAISTNLSAPIVAPSLAFSEADSKLITESVTEPKKTEPKTVAKQNAEGAAAATNHLAKTQPAEKKEPIAAPPQKTVVSNAPQTVVTNAKVAEKTEEPEKIAAVEKPPKPTHVRTNAIKSVETKNATNLPPKNPEPVVATQTMFSPKKLLLAGAVLLLVAIVLAVLLFRHSKKSEPSLISHSIDRKK